MVQRKLVKRVVRRVRRRKKSSSGLFAPARHKWLADVITFENPAKARQAADKLINAMKRGRYGRMKIGEKRALTIARALQYAANRAKASAKRSNLSRSERDELERISRIYDKAAEKAFDIYDKKYRG